MRPSVAPLLAGLLALSATALAGCSDGAADGDAALEDGPPFVLHLDALAPDAQLDAEAGVAWWEDFSATYSKRDAVLPANEMAAQHIADSLTAAGFDTQVLQYGFTGTTPAVGPVSVQVVMGLKLGTELPDEAIALGAHYDTFPGTLQGAYDNASGTAMVVSACESLAAVETRRSILCLLFDAEEEGLVGSARFVADPPEGTPEIGMFLGFDMVGLNWPGYTEFPLYTGIGGEFGDDLEPFVADVQGRVLGWEGDGLSVNPANQRSSDEQSFADAGIPTLRFAGGSSAADYDAYHAHDDTVEHVYEVAGGRDVFVAGYAAILQESVTLALLWDQTSLEEIRAEY